LPAPANKPSRADPSCLVRLKQRSQRQPSVVAVHLPSLGVLRFEVVD
jgi:hypothetical protein